MDDAQFRDALVVRRAHDHELLTEREYADELRLLRVIRPEDPYLDLDVPLPAEVQR